MTTRRQTTSLLALSGGVGGAKLALGLSDLLSPEELLIVANTGDDFEHLGLTICPDLDTIMYTLAGINNTSQGWGLADESWQSLEALRKLGGPDWFMLGDKDIATHLLRSDRLRRGCTLSAITTDLCTSLEVPYKVVPMSDDKVTTHLRTDQGVFEFQHYFVRERCKPSVQDLYFKGVETASVQADFLSALKSDDLSAIVICPSNPFLSVLPILNLSEVRALMQASTAPVIAVSPIIGGQAVKGPAAKIMSELGLHPSSLAVARYYGELLDGIVIDQVDADQADAIAALGIQPLVTSTLMQTRSDKLQLAEQVLVFSQSIADHGKRLNRVAV